MGNLNICVDFNRLSCRCRACYVNSHVCQRSWVCCKSCSWTRVFDNDWEVSSSCLRVNSSCKGLISRSDIRKSCSSYSNCTSNNTHVWIALTQSKWNWISTIRSLSGRKRNSHGLRCNSDCQVCGSSRCRRESHGLDFACDSHCEVLRNGWYSRVIC